MQEVGKHTVKKRSFAYLLIFLLVAAFVGFLIWQAAYQAVLQNVKITEQIVPEKTGQPTITPQIMADNRDHVWDIAFLPNKDMIFTERSGTVSLLKDGKPTLLHTVEDVYAQGEGGLMGLAVDPAFTQNSFIYACFTTAKDIRVARWRLNSGANKLEARTDVVTNMPTNGGVRHAGCRMAFGPDGFLWIGTGDAAQGSTPQDPKSLGGKILRIDRDGKAAPGNLGGSFDSRIYSYGHRNTQGLAFFKAPRAGALGVSVEHGSTVDDEINVLQPGNFGWAPAPSGYNELGVAMTDTTRFPDAIGALWRSGSPTQAPSGAAILDHPSWKGWQGAVAVSMLKAKHLKIVLLDASSKLVSEERVLEDAYGRLRAATLGPDGFLYISTDNGSQKDLIIRLIPN